MVPNVSKNFDFLGCAYIDNGFYMNHYHISAVFEINTTNPIEQKIALERLNYFYEVVINNAVFVDEKNIDFIEKALCLGLKISTLPDDPYDQAVGIALMYKMNAISEGKFTILNVNLISEIGNDVEFMIDIDQTYPAYTNKEIWFNAPNMQINDISKLISKKEKIVKLTRKSSEWDKIGLGWGHKLKNANEIKFQQISIETDN